METLTYSFKKATRKWWKVWQALRDDTSDTDQTDAAIGIFSKDNIPDQSIIDYGNSEKLGIKFEIETFNTRDREIIHTEFFDKLASYSSALHIVRVMQSDTLYDLTILRTMKIKLLNI